MNHVNLRLNYDQTVGVGHLCYHETILKNRSDLSSLNNGYPMTLNQIQPFLMTSLLRHSDVIAHILGTLLRVAFPSLVGAHF